MQLEAVSWISPLHASERPSIWRTQSLTNQPSRILQLEAGFAVTGQWNDLAWMERIAPQPELPGGTAKISFTSGSTGQAKGACLSASGLMETATAVSARLGDLAIERHLATLPLALLLENCAGLYAPLLRGAEIHLPGLQSLGWEGMAAFDPARLQATAQKTQASSLILVPELLKAWALYLAATGQKAPASLAYVAVGGARVDAGLIDQARGLGLPAYQGYGLTECGSVVSLNRPGDLSIAAKRGFCVDRYFDAAVGEMHRNAHEDCFIANSVRTEVRCEPRYVD